MGWNAPKGGDGEQREQCPVGEYVAVLIALVDLGHQQTADYNDPTQMVWKYQVAAVFETQGAVDSEGEPFYFAERYTFNVGSLSKLRELMTAAGISAEQDDVELLAGQPFLLTVEAAKSAKGKDYTRLVKKGGITKLPQVMRQHVKPPARPPFVWRLGEGESLEPYNWLPWLYGKKLHDVTRESWEVTHPGEPVPEKPAAKPAAPAGQQQQRPAPAPHQVQRPAPAPQQPPLTPAPAAAGKPPIGRSPGRAPQPAAQGYQPAADRDEPAF